MSDQSKALYSASDHDLKFSVDNVVENVGDDIQPSLPSCQAFKKESADKSNIFANAFPEALQRRFMSVVEKVKLLCTLQKSVALSAENSIDESQWSVIEAPLLAVAAKLHTSLDQEGRNCLRHTHDAHRQRNFAELLGRTELMLSKAFMYFDTFVDLLSQRHLPGVGPLLAGCEMLAWDALLKDHASLYNIAKPLVFFNRGFGAAILREGVPLPDGTPNPLDIIQIPYTKMTSKYDLTSIIHETGHSAMARLELADELARAVEDALTDAGAPVVIRRLYSAWCKEIGPDFWGFCNCGIAQAASLMEILMLPQQMVFKIASQTSNPPPFLRILLAFEWCRQLWGEGEWDEWEKQWLTIYPLETAPVEDRNLLAAAKARVSVVSRVLIDTPFRALGHRTILDLFHLDRIAPHHLKSIIRRAVPGRLPDMSTLSPCGQLALLRTLRDTRNLSESSIDDMMTAWLVMLSRRKKI